MKALVYIRPEYVELREVPDPLPGRDDALIEVEAVGICGSDMHAFLGHDERRPAPLILGHEAAGTVLSGALKGQRVAVNPLVTCGNCEDCLAGRTNLCARREIISMPPREGAFASLLAIPEENILKIAPEFPAEKAALTEPIACGWHAVNLAERALQRPLAMSRAVVLGGGAIGLGAALILALRGTAEIFVAETNPIRHDMLRQAGSFTVYDPLSGSAPEGGSAHIIIDAFGSSASRKAATVLVRQGGVVVHIGLAQAEGGLDVRRMTLQEVTFIGSYTYTKTEFRETLEAIAAEHLGPLDWIETRPLAEGQEAFSEMLSGKTSAAKIILNP